MSLLKRNAGILAKIESVYGTDPVPTGSANAMLVRNFTISPQETKTVARDVIRPYLGNSQNLPGTVNSKIDFEVEIAGAGAAGSAPAYGPLLRACAFAQTLNAGVSAVYSLVSTAFESVTIYCYLDKVLHKVTGCFGTVSFDFSEGAIPVMKFSFTGIYNTVTDATTPSETLTAFQLPLPVNRTNTPTFTLQGYSAVMEKLSFDMANAIAFRSLPGGNENVVLTDRKPAGSISIEATTVAAKDWWTSIKAAATGAMQLIHGVTAGNIVQVDAPAVQLYSPKYGDKDGIAMLQANLVLSPGSGNDELTLTIK